MQTLAVPALLEASKGLAAAPPFARITRVDTICWKTPQAASWRSRWTWIRVHTDSGHIGLDETYPRDKTEAVAIHSVCSRFLMTVSKRSFMNNSG